MQIELEPFIYNNIVSTTECGVIEYTPSSISGFDPFAQPGLASVTGNELTFTNFSEYEEMSELGEILSPMTI